jgi:hypothetical protein
MAVEEEEEEEEEIVIYGFTPSPEPVLIWWRRSEGSEGFWADFWLELANALKDICEEVQ